MASSSLMDLLAEKFFSFSSKMRDDSFQHYGPSFLMGSGKNNSAHPLDPFTVANVLRENSVLDFEATNPYFPNFLLNQALEILDSDHSFRLHHIWERPEYLFSHAKSTLFSPHLLNLISNLNSYSQINTRSNTSLLPTSSILFGNLMNNLFIESPETKNSKMETVVPKACNSPISEFTMSVQVSHSPAPKVDVADGKCNLSTDVKMNLKFANRKTKQINKRSKRRRRRQKKSQHLNASNTATLSDDEDSDVQSPVSSRVCFIAESPDFGCTVSFQHTLEIPSCVSSFVVPVESDCNDDSEWESYDETDNYEQTSDGVVGSTTVLSSSNSSQVQSESIESKCSMPEDVKLTSSIISFVVPVGDSSDDDSDWDSCEPGTFTETSDFEFTGLFLTNLCTPHALFSNADCNLTVASADETYESLQIKKILLEVNKNWNELPKGDMKLKSTSKVTFAPDAALVEVFPVENYERKGEWQIYATERLRFKRKIDDLEKVISPILSPEHRSKVFKKLAEPQL